MSAILDNDAGRPKLSHPAHGRRAIVVCDQWLGSNGYAGMKALRRAGWAVTVVPEWEYIPVTWRTGRMKLLARMIRGAAVREYNRALLRAAERSRPEFLLVFKGTFVKAETLREFSRMGIRTYCFFPDTSFRENGWYLIDALPQYDWIFTTKSFGLRDLENQLGMTRASLLLHAFDPDLHRPVDLTEADREQYGCDVSFIGTWSPKKEQILKTLIQRRPGLRVRIWGEQWHRALDRRTLGDVIGGHGVVGEEYVRAIRASSINLGLLIEQRPGGSSGDRVTSRSFHIPASGGFMLHERTEEIQTLFREGNEIACFECPDELEAKIDDYLERPADRMAMIDNALRAVTARHSWDYRVQDILRHHVSALDPLAGA